MKENAKLYKDLMVKRRTELDIDDLLVQFNDRLLYIKQQEVYLTIGHKGFAYICLDVAQRDLAELQLLERLNKKEFSIAELHLKEKMLGTFVLVSSIDLSKEEILPIYYTRQQVEQIFDIGKNYVNLEPLRIHKEEALRGYLLVTFMAAVITKRIQLLTKERRKKQDKLLTPISLFQNLSYQRCEVFQDTAIVAEPNAKANQGYRLFKIDYPVKISL